MDAGEQISVFRRLVSMSDGTVGPWQRYVIY